MGSGNIDVGNTTPTRKTGKPIAKRLFGSGLPELRIDHQNPSRPVRPDICGAMAQQRGDSGVHSAPQELLHLVGCREKVRPHQKDPAKR